MVGYRSALMFVSHKKLGTNIAQIVQNVCIFHLKYNSANIFVDLMLVWGKGLCKLCVLLTILLIVYTWYDNWSAEQLLCFVILDLYLLLLLLPECCLITCGIWCIHFWPESCISKCSCGMHQLIYHVEIKSVWLPYLHALHGYNLHGYPFFMHFIVLLISHFEMDASCHFWYTIFLS